MAASSPSPALVQRSLGAWRGRGREGGSLTVLHRRVGEQAPLPVARVGKLAARARRLLHEVRVLARSRHEQHGAAAVRHVRREVQRRHQVLQRLIQVDDVLTQPAAVDVRGHVPVGGGVGGGGVKRSDRFGSSCICRSATHDEEQLSWSGSNRFVVSPTELQTLLLLEATLLLVTQSGDCPFTRYSLGL